jgi:hypothetical protein
MIVSDETQGREIAAMTAHEADILALVLWKNVKQIRSLSKRDFLSPFALI